MFASDIERVLMSQVEFTRINRDTVYHRYVSGVPHCKFSFT